jgi:hypothetical protein
MFDSTEGIIKVYTDGGGYYLDVDNKYDEKFSTQSEYDDYMKSVNAVFIGYDHD